MKTTAVIVFLCFAATALIARSTVASPLPEDGVEDAVSTTTQIPAEAEAVTWTSTAQPEVTTDETTAKPEVTTLQSITETSTLPATITEDIVSTTESEPTVEVTTAAQELPSPNQEAAGVINSTAAEVVKDKLSEQIRKILRHYQQPDPVGFPGAPIPDPLSLPPMRKSLGLVNMELTNITVHGLSKFEVDQINADLKNMTVYVLLKIKRMHVLGNYTLNKFWGRPDKGPFNATLLDVEAAGTASLEPDELGHMQATDTEVDMRFRDCVLDFQNMSSLYRDSVSTFGSALFDLIKPFVTDEVNTNLKDDVNAQLKSITSKLPKMEVPVPDMAVAEGRAYVRRLGYDPYRIEDRHIRGGPLDMGVSNLTVTGLSNFRRVGDIGLEVRGSVVQMTVHVVTGVVNGTVNWSYQLGKSKMFGRTGQSNVSVDHLQVRAVVNQTLDVRNKPVLDELDLEVGRVTVQMDRSQPVDFVVETALNSLPDLVRHVIVDALEEPIKVKVQTILNEVQVEKLIEDRLPELDKLVGE